MSTDNLGEPSPAWEKVVPNHLPDLMQAIDELEAFLVGLGAAPAALYTARLAAEEMGTNILKYGYDDTEAHSILLRAEALPGAFRLVLADDGHEFNPWLAPEPDLELDLDGRTPGGLGICLIRRMARRVDYVRDQGRNVVTVEIALSGADPAT